MAGHKKTHANPLLVKKNIKIEDLEEVKSTTTVKIGEFFKHTGNVLMLKSKVDELKKKEPSIRKRKEKEELVSAWSLRSQYYLILADRQRNIVTCDPEAIKEHIKTTWPKLGGNQAKQRHKMLRLYQKGHLMLFYLGRLQKSFNDHLDKNESPLITSKPKKKPAKQSIDEPKKSDKLDQEIEKNKKYKLKLVEEIAEFEARKLALESSINKMQDERRKYEPAPSKKVHKEENSFNNDLKNYSPNFFSDFLNDNRIKDQAREQEDGSNEYPRFFYNGDIDLEWPNTP